MIKNDRLLEQQLKAKIIQVETIGDDYMVVSGLPKVHENHAQEIAGMSLR